MSAKKKRCLERSPGKERDTVVDPNVGILEPFAATNVAEDDEDDPQATDGYTDTSAPLSTKKSCPVRTSFKQSVLGGDEEEAEEGEEETRRTTS